MMWILHDRGVERALHYLDDFLVLGPATQPDCQRDFDTVLSLCGELGFPVVPEKTEGPTTTLTFLGIEIDSVQQELRLPWDKQDRLQATLNRWMHGTAAAAPRGSMKKRDLLSLIGLLNHAATVVRPGRAFLRSLIDASTAVRDLDHWAHLDMGARADLAWWSTFLHTWNGVSITPPMNIPLVMVSDASGFLGLWRIVRGFMVSTPVATGMGISLHRGKRASPDSGLGNTLGPLLGRQTHPLLMR